MAVGGVRNRLWSTLHYFNLITTLSLVWVRPISAADAFPEFTEQPESQIIAHDSPATLRCSATPIDAQIRWLFNGRPLDERRHKGLKIVGSNLHFPTVKSESDENTMVGTYSCTATTKEGTIISQPARLSKPVISPFPPTDDISVVVPEGGYVTLTCVPPKSNPAAYVVFQTADGQLVDTSKDTLYQLPSGNLVLHNITSADAGEFRCVAVNPVSGQNRTAPGAIHLSLGVGHLGAETTNIMQPLIKHKVQVLRGTDVTLECPSYGQQESNIRWRKLKGRLPYRRFTVTRFGNLHIRDTQITDRGNYLCGEVRRISLQILIPPVIEKIQRPAPVVGVGQRVEMLCSVTGDPVPELHWFHNGREITGNSNGTLVLVKASRADSGIYQCVATSRLGTVHEAMRLEVRVQPRAVSRQTGTPNTADAEDGEKTSGKDKIEDQGKKSGRRDRKKNGRRKKMRMRDRRKKKKNGHGGQGEEKPKYAPSVPKVTQLSDRSVMLNWSVPDKGNGQTIKFFKVQFKEMSPQKGPWQTSDAHLTYDTRRFEVSDLKSGGSYKFRILAVYEDDDNKNSANTPLFKLTPQRHAQAQPPDTAPTIVAVTPIVYKQNFGLGIKWQYLPESASPIEGFIIFYKPFGSTGDDKEWILPGAGIRNHVISDLLPNTPYDIRMQSFNIAGPSQFSNQVVEFTKSRADSSGNEDTPDIELPIEIPPEKSTDSPVSGRHSSDTLEQPVILGIVLGALLLALFILVTMCWWKQRQQKRRNLSSSTQQKFQDQSQCIFADVAHTKPNGGLYPANETAPVANGHGPRHDNHSRMKIDVNPLAEYDLQTSSHGEGRPKQFYGNGVNGMVTRYGGENSCNNNSCQHASNNHPGCNGGEHGYMEKAPYPMQHRTLPVTPNQPLYSFYSEAGSLGRSVNHEYSELASRGRHSPINPHSVYKQNLGHPNMGGQMRNYDHNWSSPYDQHHVDTSNMSSSERLSPTYPSSIDFAGNQNRFQHPKHLMPSLPASSAPHGPSSSSFETGPGAVGVGFMGSHGGGKHKRRRKRPNVRDQTRREHAMKDQATNTDLSSNEGTFEFTTFRKSGSSSNSGSEVGRNCDSSFANNGSLESINDSHSATSTTSHEPEPHRLGTLPVSL